MKKHLLIITLLSSLKLFADEPNTLSEKEKADGWILLFNGKDLSNWRQFRSEKEPGLGWKIENDTLKKLAAIPGGNIVTKETYSDFTLIWEWSIKKDGNNGIKYLVNEERPNAPGPEYQMIDDQGHRDSRSNPKRRTASLYDIFPPAEDKVLKPVGEWNSSKIIVEGNKVQHWLNGSLVLTYELGSEALKTAIAKSKFKKADGFPEKFKGHIMLTDHFDECLYRNIKLLPATTK